MGLFMEGSLTSPALGAHGTETAPSPNTSLPSDAIRQAALRSLRASSHRVDATRKSRARWAPIDRVLDRAGRGAFVRRVGPQDRSRLQYADRAIRPPRSATWEPQRCAAYADAARARR